MSIEMKTLPHSSSAMHIHDEVVIEADPHMSLDAVCKLMGRIPWFDSPCCRLYIPIQQERLALSLRSLSVTWSVSTDQVVYLQAFFKHTVSIRSFLNLLEKIFKIVPLKIAPHVQ